MGDFDDATVDKDLLSQIFADDGDDEIMKDLVEGDSEETEGANDMEASIIEDEAEKIPVPEMSDLEEKTPEEEKAEEIVEVPAAEPVSEEKTVEMPASVSDSGAEDDIVREEAMELERKNGTVTVIAEKTTITGSISSDGSLEVMGTITGDIECMGKVYINGNVSGSVTASEIYVNTPKLTGDLQCEGKVRVGVGVGTIIIGDIVGDSAYIAGAVKGNIDVDGPVIIDSTAIVKGDIKAKSIQINTGAVVDGYCSLSYAGVDLEKFFE